MKSLRLLVVLALATVFLTSYAFAQAPAITNVNVKDTHCYYSVGVSTKLCSIAPGMTLTILGSNFGASPGGVSLCNCPAATIVTWTSTRIVVTVNAATPSSGLVVENVGGGVSNSVAYIALAPLITSIAVGGCTYIPNQSPLLCLINAGDQVTINGSYFGPASGGGYAATCSDCGVSPTIISWDPNWSTAPSPYNNQIVITANQAVCGSTISVWFDTMGSNYVPYTAC